MIKSKKNGGQCEKAVSPLEIYIHIPFCVKKCAYCDFLSGSCTDEKIERYVDALVQEIGASGVDKGTYVVRTIFVGGGTPSILTPNQIEQIFKAIRTSFNVLEDAEITLEANPGTVTKEKLLAYKNVGINRLSFGLQSTNNKELQLLGRIHTYEDFLDNFQLARDYGFTNINVDLISAIPKQTVQSWEQTLKQVASLDTEHISAYSLIVEEGTPFSKIYGEGCPREKELPSEEEERTIYYRTEEILKDYGYHRYEISNYAKRGKECRHNLGYWERKEYLGIGLGAASLFNRSRYKNTDNLDYYICNASEPERVQEGLEKLNVKSEMEEFMFLGLRKMEGVSEIEFESCFNRTLKECYGTQIENLISQGLLWKENGNLRLTKKGIDVSNYVFAAFIDV